MKTGLDHLPPRKQHDIARIVAILFEEFGKKVANKKVDYKRNAQILKVILYGSHARGTWVHDNISGYVSDYDILVVVNHPKLTETGHYWRHAEDRLMADYISGEGLAAPLGLIVHDLDDINAQLERGRYFFMDILKEGIVLQEATDAHFAEPTPLTPDVAYEEAQGYFETWTKSSKTFLSTSAFAKEEGDLKIAAFLLHQAAERLYHCMLLTFTLYTPQSHNLNFLRPRAEALDRRIVDAWPRATKPERWPYELTRRAYVEARYSPHYLITPDEFATATAQVTRLRDLVRAACEERLAEMKAKVGG